MSSHNNPLNLNDNYVPELMRVCIDEANRLFEKDPQNGEQEKLKARLYGINRQVDALAERLAQIPKTVSAVPIFKQMEKLETAKQEIEKQIQLLDQQSQSGEKTAELQTFEGFGKYLRNMISSSADSSLKAKIIGKLIHRINVNKEGVKIHYYVGHEYFERSLVEIKSSQQGENPDSLFLKCVGSNSLTNGARRGT
jgi:hypothetical protein